MRTLEDVEDGLNDSLGDKVNDYRKRLWEDHGVTKEDQPKTILEENNEENKSEK